ncbi:MAG: pyrimidine 5'-nucleotidase [Sphingorhabdus sp.]
MDSDFSHINTWIFDLDLTLYPPEADIMAQIRDRIALYVERYFKIGTQEAHDIRYAYWKQYGTTLGGLMAEHDVDPRGYLDFVHDVDFAKLVASPELKRHIEALPGRKLIFTNADAPYAQRVLSARGLEGVFEDIYDIHRMGHIPKPAPPSYHALCNELSILPAQALFVEDSAHNLVPAKVMGMTTIWVNNGNEAVSSDHAMHIDHQIDDVTDWLSTIQTRERAL